MYDFIQFNRINNSGILPKILLLRTTYLKNISPTCTKSFVNDYELDNYNSVCNIKYLLIIIIRCLWIDIAPENYSQYVPIYSIK